MILSLDSWSVVEISLVQLLFNKITLKLALLSLDCGGTIELQTGKTENIKSPNFPEKYPTGKLCRWVVKVYAFYELKRQNRK